MLLAGKGGVGRGDGAVTALGDGREDEAEGVGTGAALIGGGRDGWAGGCGGVGRHGDSSAVIGRREGLRGGEGGTGGCQKRAVFGLW